MADKNEKNLLEFLNKIKKVFPNDLMIYHNYYIIPGIKSSEKLDGLVLLVIEEKYRELLSTVLNEKNSYEILSIDDFKNNIGEDMSEYYTEISDNYFKLPNSYDDDDSIIETLLSETSSEDIIWNRLSDQIDISKTFFDNKSTYELKITDNKYNISDVVTIGKELFPHLTEKNIDVLYYTSKYDASRDLFITYFDFRWSYFQMICRYFSIPILNN